MMNNKCVPFFACLVILLTGCNEGADEKYFTTFDGIKTDQFTSKPGGRGVYWLSNEEIILDGVSLNEREEFLHGLYKVTLDGQYERIVEVADQKKWSYCVSEGVIYTRYKNNNNIILSKNTEIIERKSGLKTRGNVFSYLRCQYVNRPSADKSYLPLLERDGLIVLPLNKKNLESHKYKIVTGDGDDIIEIKPIPFRTTSRLSTNYYKFSDAYFGYDARQNCVIHWTLKRSDWSLDKEEFCLGKWAYNSSKVINLTKVGLFIEHHSHKKPAAYLVKDGKEYLIDTVMARGASVSPDGCKVAYASGKIGYNENRFSQILKVFNACEFIKDQEGEG